MISFGTGGFRAIMSEDFTKENVQKTAQALSNIIKKEKSTNPVLVGYDRRFMSDTFAQWFIEVLAKNKIKSLIFPRPVSTPMVMYGVMKDELDYGVTITASHNPYMYNGIKICKKGGIDANIEFTSKLEKIANSLKKVKTLDFNTAKELNLVTEYDNSKEYIANLTKLASKDIKENKLKVLFNAMHGTTANDIKTLFKKLNISKFDILNEDSDPTFEFKLPSPNEETLVDFQKDVVKGRYSIGIACDGDGDRIGIVDELGNYHNCNIIMAIIYYYLIKYRGFKGDVVRNMSTSYLLDKIAESFGYKCHEVPVGFKWVSAKMQETDALLGGESSGGLTIRGYTPCKDSLLSVTLILDALAIIKKPLSKIIQTIKDSCEFLSEYHENSITVKSKAKLNKALKKHMPNFPYKPSKVSYEDGTKYYFDDGSFVHIRFSGTEDLLRYHFEFPTAVECDRTLKAIENFIKNYDKK